jgi:hypothetical protein
LREPFGFGGDVEQQLRVVTFVGHHRVDQQPHRFGEPGAFRRREVGGVG